MCLERAEAELDASAEVERLSERADLRRCTDRPDPAAARRHRHPHGVPSRPRVAVGAVDGEAAREDDADVAARAAAVAPVDARGVRAPCGGEGRDEAAELVAGDAAP